MNIDKPGTFRRKAIKISQTSLIKTSLLQSSNFPLLIVQPAMHGVDLISWAQSNRKSNEALLLKHGAILFRDFNIGGISKFQQFIAAASDTELLEYTYRSTPRSLVSGRIYTSTEYPAHQFIPLHNEMSYSHKWPTKIWFFCVQPAQSGGETPIADGRRVFQRLRPEIRWRFIDEKVRYVRNYGDSLDISWQTAFQTTERATVEEYCRNAGIVYEWREGNRLRTSQVCQAVITHPVLGETVWFNQAHLFHVSSLEPTIRESVLAQYKEEDLPRNAYYGSGGGIEASALDEIREAYKQEMATFTWQQGDILMLDNLLVAHGRTPFTGPRKIVVGMA
jgi:alpha-ketoglutarate-dependent taurine dioxygenase